MKKRRNPWNPPMSGFDKKKGKTDAFYGQHKWKMMSRAYRAKHSKCAVKSCTELVSTVSGQRHTGVTDHIIPREQEGADYDKSNFMSLCHSHHNKKSRLEQMYHILYHFELNEKGRKVPKRDEDGNIMPIAGRGGQFIFN